MNPLALDSTMKTSPEGATSTATALPARLSKCS